MEVKQATYSGLLPLPPFTQEILEEIKDEKQKQALSTEFVSDTEEIDNRTVLVACKDEHSCMQLEECIAKGPRKVLNILTLISYLSVFLYVSCLQKCIFCCLISYLLVFLLIILYVSDARCKE